MTLHEHLHWRYATKQFTTDKTVSEADLNYILEAGNLAATSYGLQPFGIVVVTDQAQKDVLQAAAYNQEQVGHNSALLVICARTDVDADYIANYTKLIETTRDLEPGATDDFKNVMVQTLTNLPKEQLQSWCEKQTYLVLATMMAAAAEKRVDGCPMEGFDNQEVNNILGLAEHNLHATTLFPIGYRADSDNTQHYKKVRKDFDQVIIKK